MKKLFIAMAVVAAACFASCSQPKQEEAPAKTGIIRLNCTVKVTPEVRDSVLTLSKELVNASRQNDGPISYDIFESATDSNTLLIFETWPDQPTLDKHSASEHFTRIVPQIQALGQMTIEQFQADK